MAIAYGDSGSKSAALLANIGAVQIDPNPRGYGQTGAWEIPDSWVTGSDEYGTRYFAVPDGRSFATQCGDAHSRGRTWQASPSQIDDFAAWKYATAQQGFGGDYAEWQAMPSAERQEYECGASGIGTV